MIYYYDDLFIYFVTVTETNTLDNPMSHENRLIQSTTLGAPQSRSDGFYLCHLPMQYDLTWESELE